MLLTVILLSGVVLASTSLAGLLILYQLRQATDAKDSMRAIFAADAGLEWAFYNETRATPETYPHVINLSDGAKVTITYDSNDSLPIKVVGQYGRVARAFQANSPVGGESKFDVMFVLDRSGSIIDTELALVKAAANAFIDTIVPSLTGSHVGLVSFATDATLDQHLTDNGAAVKVSIDAMSNKNRGQTNLSQAIDLADGEFNNLHTIHERPEVKDVMIVVTDGDPNQNKPGDTRTARIAAALEADEARLADIEIYVVGIGVTPSTEAFLKTDIADDVAHYYPIADFSGLEDILEAIAEAILSTREVGP